MYCVPPKKRTLAGSECQEEVQSGPVSTLSQQPSLQSLLPLGSSMMPGSLSGSPFATASVLGASFKAVSLEQDEQKRLAQEKRKVEHDLKMKGLELEKLKVELEQSKKKMLQLPSTFEAKIKQLEEERGYLFESAKKSKEALVAAQEEMLALKERVLYSKGESQDSQQEAKIAQLERTIAKLRNDMKLNLEEYSHEMAEMTKEKKALQTDLEEKCRRIDLQQKELEELNGKFDEAQIQLLMTGKRVSEERDTAVLEKISFSKVNEALQLEKEHRKLVQENERLKASCKASSLLEERLRDAEVKLGAQRQLEQRLAVLEAENRILKENRTAKSDEAGPSTYRSLMEKTMESARLQEELGELRGQVRSKVRDLEVSKEEIERLRADTMELKARLGEKEAALLKSTEELKLARVQVDMLKDQIQSPVIID